MSHDPDPSTSTSGNKPCSGAGEAFDHDGQLIYTPDVVDCISPGAEL